MEDAIGNPLTPEKADEWMAALKTAAISVRRETRKLIRKGRKDQLGSYINAVIDGALNDSAGRKHWACTRGCAYCCELGVAVSPPEAFLIARILRQEMPADELDVFRATLRDRAAQAESATGGRDYMQRKIKCAFLTEDNQCAIHQIRPMVCKGYASFDRDSCRRFAETEGEAMLGDEGARMITASLMAGFKEAVREAYLDGAFYELHAAILVALDSPNALKRWKAGHQVFGKPAMREP